VPARRADWEQPYLTPRMFYGLGERRGMTRAKKRRGRVVGTSELWSVCKAIGGSSVVV